MIYGNVLRRARIHRTFSHLIKAPIWEVRAHHANWCCGGVNWIKSFFSWFTWAIARMTCHTANHTRSRMSLEINKQRDRSHACTLHIDHDIISGRSHPRFSLECRGDYASVRACVKDKTSTHRRHKKVLHRSYATMRAWDLHAHARSLRLLRHGQSRPNTKTVPVWFFRLSFSSQNRNGQPGRIKIMVNPQKHK